MCIINVQLVISTDMQEPAIEIVIQLGRMRIHKNCIVCYLHYLVGAIRFIYLFIHILFFIQSISPFCVSFFKCQIFGWSFMLCIDKDKFKIEMVVICLTCSN